MKGPAVYRLWKGSQNVYHEKFEWKPSQKQFYRRQSLEAALFLGAGAVAISHSLVYIVGHVRPVIISLRPVVHTLFTWRSWLSWVMQVM